VQTGFIPTTMNELMSRFVYNMHRNEAKDEFDTYGKHLSSQDPKFLDDDVIEHNVTRTIAPI
jgi:hypothetical protein